MPIKVYETTTHHIKSTNHFCTYHDKMVAESVDAAITNAIAGSGATDPIVSDLVQEDIPALPGLRACRVRSGVVYSYWVSGKTLPASLPAGDILLFDPAKFPELQAYQGDPLFVGVRFWNPDTGAQVLGPNAKVSEAGIYLMNTSGAGPAPEGVHLSYQQILLLGPSAK